MAEGGVNVEKELYTPKRVASVGDYAKALESTCFAPSRLMRNAAEYVESGKFDDALQTTLDGLKKRNIELEIIPRGDIYRGTIVIDGKKTMILPPDFESLHPAKKLDHLLSRNTSLILQRIGERENPQLFRQRIMMKIAYAQTLRLGATHVSETEKEKITKIADDIEDESAFRLENLKKQFN